MTVDEPEWIRVTDDNAEEIAVRLAGLKVTGFEREPSTAASWPTGANAVTITFDDGSRLEFCGWGYDASGLDTDYVPPV